MTKKQVMKQIKSLMKETRQRILTKSEYLLNSGAVEPANYTKDDYLLAKVILDTALKDASDNWHPLSDEGRAIAKNLEHF